MTPSFPKPNGAWGKGRSRNERRGLWDNREARRQTHIHPIECCGDRLSPAAASLLKSGSAQSERIAWAIWKSVSKDLCLPETGNKDSCVYTEGGDTQPEDADIPVPGGGQRGRAVSPRPGKGSARKHTGGRGGAGTKSGGTRRLLDESDPWKPNELRSEGKQTATLPPPSPVAQFPLQQSFIRAPISPAQVTLGRGQDLPVRSHLGWTTKDTVTQQCEGLFLEARTGGGWTRNGTFIPARARASEKPAGRGCGPGGRRRVRSGAFLHLELPSGTAWPWLRPLGAEPAVGGRGALGPRRAIGWQSTPFHFHVAAFYASRLLASRSRVCFAS